ncbi:MAG: glycosyltransferase [Candidatus Helarchaeota archaeon]
MNIPYVSIVIPVFNGEKLIEKCLQSLNKLDYPKDKYEIIVVDGGSDDKTVDKVRKFNNIRLIEAGKGTSLQRNIGIKEAKGEFVALTDSDCVVDPQWLKNGVIGFKDKNVALIGGPNQTPENSKFLENAAGCVLSSKLATAAMSKRYAGNGIKEANETDLIACNNIIRKEVLDEIGGFNESFFPAEENELYFRLKQKGYKLLYNSEMVVWHHRVPLYLPFSKQIYKYGQFRAKLVKTQLKIFKPIFLLPTLLFFYILLGGILSGLIISGILSFSKPTLFTNSVFSIDSMLLYFYFGSLIFYYLLTLIESGIYSIKEKDIKLFFALPLAYFLLHMSYGVGFLTGLLKL